MSTFDDAFDHVVGLEGGWNDYPDDPETIWGINRDANPDWEGWGWVDALKAGADFPKNVNTDDQIKTMAKSRYWSHYWNQVKGDDIPHESVAAVLLDVAVHSGVSTAGRFLQDALNLLRRPHEDPYFAELLLDGVIGNKTLRAYDVLVLVDGSANTERYLLTLLRGLQVSTYVSLARTYPKHSKRVRGYLARVTTQA